MLREMVIENIAVIEKAEISFCQGFNVLSGETGTGKSLILDSLNAISGARTSRDIIRTGEKAGSVTAVFDNLPKNVENLLREQGIEQDEVLILRREIFSDGRNNCRINGAPVTLSTLRCIGESLVSIHGQHDGRNLMDESLHIEYLDSFGEISSALLEYQKKYELLAGLNKKLKSLSEMESAKAQRLSELEEIIGDISPLEPTVGEYDRLLRRRTEMTAELNMVNALSKAAAYIDGDGEEPGAGALISSAMRELKDVKDITERTEQVFELVNELSGLIAARYNSLDVSEEELAEVEKRLDDLQRIAVKYSCREDDLPDMLSNAAEERQRLESSGEELTKLQEQYSAMREDVSKTAKLLHDTRVQASKELSVKIEEKLVRLDMPGARFFVEIESTMGQSRARFTKKGTDNVRFLLAANRGEELKPLSKVASGGELSRIMLAVRTVLTKADESVSAVFDEIDAGVSGRAASHVGEFMYQIALKQQVLCVTHLPQIACLADRQFRISKRDENGRVYTLVTPLEEQGRAEELARLMSGTYVEQMSLEGAKKLLESAEDAKKRVREEA